MKINFNLFDKGDIVAVAVSGGEDSMALLHILNAKQAELSVKVVCCNVEHGIRGESSLKDSEFVKNYCKKNKIPFYGFKVDSLSYASENSVGIEEAARILRYNALSSLIAEKKATKIAVAHHLSDNAETVLLNLFRGVSGMSIHGMKEVKGDIVRPMLKTSKEEIREYVKLNNIPYVFDETNAVADNKRNFFRLKIAPLIKEIFPEYEKSIERFCELTGIQAEYFDRLADSLITQKREGVEISITSEKAIFGRAVVKAFSLIGWKKDYTKKHVDAVCGLAESENGKRIELPSGIRAVREYDKITLYRQKEQTEWEIPFGLGRFYTGEGELLLERFYGKPDFKSGLYFDLDKIPDGAVFRFKKRGDTFNRFGGKRKKLGDYLTDIKYPARLRSSIPILAKGSEVLILGQIEISEDVKVDKRTAIVVKLTYQSDTKE